MIAIERGSGGEPEMTAPREPDRVRDQRIEQIVPLLTPAEILDELPLDGERAEVVLRGRAEVERILDQDDDRLLVVVGPCSVHDVDAALEYARLLAAAADGAARRPLHRDARVLREAAHHHRLEGHDQRPPPRRLGGREQPACAWPAACCSRCSAWACRWAASSSTRSSRSTSPTPWPGARSARAPPRARPTASSAPACRCPWASRTARTATCRWRWTPCAPPRCRTPSPAWTTTAGRRSSTPRATRTAT